MSYTFMDFCAGIGGGRLGLEKAGFKCVGFSEINKNSEFTYKTFFGNDEKNFGDLMTIDINKLPNFDLLIAGFPCQTFSIIGQRKGMEDERGQIILGIKKILKEKRIKYFILENVKGLVNHNKGETLKNIISLLNEAGYYTSWKVLNTIDYGLPQSRERIYFLGVRKDLGPFKSKLKFPEKIDKIGLDDFLIEISDKYCFSDSRIQTMHSYINNKYNNGTLSLTNLIHKTGYIIDTRQSDIRLYKDFCPTLRTGRHGIVYSRGGKLRELSPLESLLLQGFPYERAKQVIGKTQDKNILGQAGNAMSVNVIEAIGKEFMNFILLNNDSNDRSKTTMIQNRKTVIGKGIGSHGYDKSLANK